MGQKNCQNLGFWQIFATFGDQNVSGMFSQFTKKVTKCSKISVLSDFCQNMWAMFPENVSISDQNCAKTEIFVR